MEGKEVIYKIVALCIVVFLIVVCESLMITAKRADERAERMYRRWKDERSNSAPDK
jgi:hypothetical protein